ncbi:MAG: N-terminal phage integrase SAM-like domain-containing protein [Sporolactobacillus sp.]|jgi:hypothetical protein|nr:N-terminal phage integrase SAM-like domain-containing protein [Sporolactobacillus sp.]
MKSGFKTKKEAQVEAGVIEERIYRGQTTVVKNQKMLVKDWLKEWLEVYNKRIKLKTYAYRKDYVNRVIIPAIGNYRLGGMTKAQYQRFINKLQKKYKKEPYSPFDRLHSI